MNRETRNELLKMVAIIQKHSVDYSEVIEVIEYYIYLTKNRRVKIQRAPRNIVDLELSRIAFEAASRYIMRLYLDRKLEG